METIYLLLIGILGLAGLSALFQFYRTNRNLENEVDHLKETNKRQFTSLLDERETLFKVNSKIAGLQDSLLLIKQERSLLEAKLAASDSKLQSFIKPSNDVLAIAVEDVVAIIDVPVKKPYKKTSKTRNKPNNKSI